MAYKPVYYHPVASIDPEYLWIVIVGGIFCWGAAWGIGANDTCNSWGSTVGSKGISVRNAAILAGIFEVTGAFSLGANVGGTFKSKIVSPTLFCDDNYSLVVRMLGIMCVDMAVFAWLVIANKMSLPVSTTHASVGGVVGFGVITRGWESITWWTTVGYIFISFPVSPAFSIICGYIIQWLAMKFLLSGAEGTIFRKNVMWLPAICSVFLGVAAVFAVYIGGKSNNDMKELPEWVFIVTFFGTSFGLMPILYLASHIIRKRKNIDLDAYLPSNPSNVRLDVVDDEAIWYDGPPVLLDAPPSTPDQPLAQENQTSQETHDTQDNRSTNGSQKADDVKEESNEFVKNDVYAGFSAERIAVENLWKPFCCVVASVESFAHGANDVGNAIGPYAGMVDAYNKACPKGTGSIPYWILGLGASGIMIGLITYGHKVMRTLGTEIAVITPQRAAASEMATVITVLIATALAIPVSTTHCAVGGITGVALAQFGWRDLKWITLRDVVICMVLTVPACCLMCAALFGFAHAAVFGAAYPGPSAFHKAMNVTRRGPF